METGRTRKEKGDLAEVMVAADVVRRGYKIAEGKTYLHLRLTEPLNNQKRGIRRAKEYLDL